MENDTLQSLNIGFDELLFQLSKGVTIEQYEKGMRWFGLEKVKEWKSRFGYQFHIYSNDHLIENKPHFHLLKESDGIDCKYFFDGTLIECKNFNQTDKSVVKELLYFLSKKDQQMRIIELWNSKNPNQKYINK
jgi:hypothetical protein